MLDYNVPGGKLNRGMAVGDILLHLTKDVCPMTASVLCFIILPWPPWSFSYAPGLHFRGVALP